MKIIIPLLLAAAIIGLQNGKAQAMKSDTTTGIVSISKPVRIAKKDARHFKLSKDELKIFKAENLPNTSDYLKPNRDYTSDPAMLDDSAYVKAFRAVAFNKALSQEEHPNRKGFLIAGGVTVTVVVVLILFSEVFRNYN